MSMTKTLVHTAAPAVTTTTNPTRRFLLPATGEGEDMGLVMRLDRNLGNAPMNPAKLCQMPKTKLARWALFTWTFQVNKVNESMQKLFIRLLPIMLYMSLLVSAIQAVGVIYLLAASVLPLGVWFLLICLTLMCYFFVSTSVQNMAGASLSRRPSNSSTASITPSSTSQNLEKTVS